MGTQTVQNASKPKSDAYIGSTINGIQRWYKHLVCDVGGLAACNDPSKCSSWKLSIDSCMTRLTDDIETRLNMDTVGSDNAVDLKIMKKNIANLKTNVNRMMQAQEAQAQAQRRAQAQTQALRGGARSSGKVCST